MVPGYERVLQRGHERVGLQPPHEQFLGRLVVVTITANHVRQYQRVAVQVHRQESGHQRFKSVIEAPVCVFVYHADEHW